MERNFRPASKSNALFDDYTSGIFFGRYVCTYDQSVNILKKKCQRLDFHD